MPVAPPARHGMRNRRLRLGDAPRGVSTVGSWRCLANQPWPPLGSDSMRTFLGGFQSRPPNVETPRGASPEAATSSRPASYPPRAPRHRNSADTFRRWQETPHGASLHWDQVVALRINLGPLCGSDSIRTFLGGFQSRPPTVETPRGASPQAATSSRPASYPP